MQRHNRDVHEGNDIRISAAINTCGKIGKTSLDLEMWLRLNQEIEDEELISFLISMWEFEALVQPEIELAELSARHTTSVNLVAVELYNSKMKDYSYEQSLADIQYAVAAVRKPPDDNQRDLKHQHSCGTLRTFMPIDPSS